jgi:hypothetical protein
MVSGGEPPAAGPRSQFGLATAAGASRYGAIRFDGLE